MPSEDFLADLWGSPEPEQPLKSSKSNSFNSIKLAQYFQSSLFDSYWATGFAAVNIKALAGQFAQWKKNGATVEEVTAMIDLYMLEPKMRGKNPGWQDFLYRREQLATSLASTGEKTQHTAELDKWDKLDEEYDDEAELRKYLESRRNT